MPVRSTFQLPKRLLLLFRRSFFRLASLLFIALALSTPKNWPRYRSRSNISSASQLHLQHKNLQLTIIYELLYSILSMSVFVYFFACVCTAVWVSVFLFLHTNNVLYSMSSTNVYIWAEYIDARFFHTHTHTLTPHADTKNHCKMHMWNFH